MRHIGRFRRGDESFAIRTEAHAFRLDPDLHLTERNASLQVDDRDRVVVLVGHVEYLARGILCEQLGIRTRGQRGYDLVGSYVDHFYRVVVSDGHKHEFLGIYHADGVALLVRDIGGEGARLAADEREHAQPEQATARPDDAKQKTPDVGLFRHRLFEPALTFGTVDPERIQFGNLMHKSFLRRH